jgi:MFS family permease
MALTSIDPDRPTAALGSPDRLKAAIAAALGTCVENYDFIAYGTASALYFGAVFFPGENPVVGTILAFATLAVGFLMRPIGGAIGGYLGDRFGRKPVLVAAMLVMGTSTFLVGLLPSFGEVGLLAPILLIAIRVIQGLAFGAEWGGAVTMAYEHAPWNRRGMFAAIPQSGNPLGIALASFMFLWSVNLPGDWAWRVPFLSSAVLVIVGLIVRARLSESPEFEAAKVKHEVEKNPFLATFRKDWRGVVRVISLRIVEAFAYYLTATYLLNYISTNHPDVKNTVLAALSIASVLAIFTTFLAGTLTDRIGRRPMYIAACVAAILFAFPMYLLTNNGTPALVILVFVLGIGCIHATLTGTQGSLLTEQFRTSTRTSGASIGYQIAASLGGFAPLIAALLTTQIGWPGAAILYAAAACVGLIGVLCTRETWGRKERERVNKIVEEARAEEARGGTRSAEPVVVH